MKRTLVIFLDYREPRDIWRSNLTNEKLQVQQSELGEVK